jgi:hypothetical protein
MVVHIISLGKIQDPVTLVSFEATLRKSLSILVKRFPCIPDLNVNEDDMVGDSWVSVISRISSYYDHRPRVVICLDDFDIAVCNVSNAVEFNSVLSAMDEFNIRLSRVAIVLFCGHLSCFKCEISYGKVLSSEECPYKLFGCPLSDFPETDRKEKKMFFGRSNTGIMDEIHPMAYSGTLGSGNGFEIHNLKYLFRILRGNTNTLKIISSLVTSGYYDCSIRYDDPVLMSALKEGVVTVDEFMHVLYRFGLLRFHSKSNETDSPLESTYVTLQPARVQYYLCFPNRVYAWSLIKYFAKNFVPVSFSELWSDGFESKNHTSVLASLFTLVSDCQNEVLTCEKDLSDLLCEKLVAMIFPRFLILQEYSPEEDRQTRLDMGLLLASPLCGVVYVVELARIDGVHNVTHEHLMAESNIKFHLIYSKSYYKVYTRFGIPETNCQILLVTIIYHMAKFVMIRISEYDASKKCACQDHKLLCENAVYRDIRVPLYVDLQLLKKADDLRSSMNVAH